MTSAYGNNIFESIPRIEDAFFMHSILQYRSSMARALGCLPRSCGFESRRYCLCSVRIVVSTSGFRPGNAGSIPVRSTGASELAQCVNYSMCKCVNGGCERALLFIDAKPWHVPICLHHSFCRQV